MNNVVVKILALLHVLAFMPCNATKVNYNQSRNEVEIMHEFDVKESLLRNDDGLLYNTCVLVPPAPADKVKFVITAPRTVYVGQKFNVYFSIHADSKVNIPFWADLIPDEMQASAQGLKYISHNNPTMGEFAKMVNSMAYKGGKGQWNLNGILNARNVVHMSVTLQATTPGRKKYSTLVATNPPALLTMALDSHNELPHAVSDFAQGLQNKPLVISVLDNDYAMSALNIMQVMQGVHGKVTINQDNTLTYMPDHDFVGSDKFSYVIQDAAGNRAQADVMVMIAECPAPQIIR